MLDHIGRNYPWPDFIIGGAPRSGTTYLCEVLDRHPQVFMARPFIPEPKVFMGSPKQAEDYRRAYESFFAKASTTQLRGEKTSGYFESLECCSLIKEFVTGVKLIFIVREPVARAYSNWIRSSVNGLETLSFEEAVEVEGLRPSPLPPEKSYARPFDYLTRGNYTQFANCYFTAFGRDAVRFFLYEDIARDAHDLLARIQSFLGIAERPEDAEGLGLVNSVRDQGTPILPETEMKLRKRFRPEVESFAALTGVDLSAWKY